jgi:hypothetical protein
MECVMRTHLQMKELQSAKIREIGHALRRAGYIALDEQARALGLPRSTAWTVLRATHKSSGLTGGVISRMLSAPDLPPSVREKLIEYISEKAAGLYGQCCGRRRKSLLALSDLVEGAAKASSLRRT